jgi:cell wall-associated NlpC family hydrolase
LRREQRNRVALTARLAGERAAITSGIATQRRLLASIHETIATLVARQAAEQRRLAALRQRRIAREVAAARRRAAAAAVRQAAPPVIQPASSDPTPAPPAAETPPAAPPPAAPAPTPPAAPPPAPAPPSPAPAHATAASIAARYLGVPYVWGGGSPAGFDCSGLVTYVYAQLGISLPHYTVAQWNATAAIPTSALEPGDLVFFNGLGHVGIYIGGGQFIHAPHTGTVVQIASLSGYWAAHLDGARRVG